MISFNIEQVLAELAAEEILHDIPEELSVAEFFPYSGSALFAREDDGLSMNRTAALESLNDEEESEAMWYHNEDDEEN